MPKVCSQKTIPLFPIKLKGVAQVLACQKTSSNAGSGPDEEFDTPRVVGPVFQAGRALKVSCLEVVRLIIPPGAFAQNSPLRTVITGLNQRRFEHR